MVNFNGLASHIVGGEIYYDCLGGDNYQVTIKIYRDCNSSTGYDDNLPLTVFDGNGVIYSEHTIPFPGSQVLPVIFNNPCVTIPPGICVEEAIYQTVINLPPSANGYTLSYQKCCRTDIALNLTDPGNQGITLTVDIPPSGTAICNSSPRFNNYPPLLLCADQELVFDHSATDPDGDSLAYELCDPLQGGGPAFLPPNCPGCASPIPASPPPYAPIIWQSGINSSIPFGGAAPVSINPISGLLLATPVQPGNFAFAVCVKEYRNGVLIGTSVRDFICQVMDCEVQLESIIVPQANMSTFVSYCQGMTITFENNSYGGTDYSWDFGVPGTSSDVSSATTPTYTFPGPGTYDVTLIVNQGLPCTDTSIQTFEINDEITVNFNPPSAQCITNNSFDFTGSGQYPATGVNYTWEFGLNTNPDSAFTETVYNVVFNDYGYLPVVYTVSTDLCEVSHEDSVFVYAEPSIDFYISDELKCAPYEAHFLDQSFASTDIFYEWDFGDGSELSPDSDPIHTYYEPGVFDVTLTIWTTSGCIDTLTMFMPGLIEIWPSPTSLFTVNPHTATVFYPNFYFEDFSSGGVEHWYYFTDGDSTNETHVWHSYIESGYHYPYQVVINEYGCPDTTWQEIYLEPYTTIYVPNAFTPNGDGKNDIWKPVVYDTEEYEILVFDQWGQLILESNDESASWDGTINGKKADMGVYVWKIKYTDSETGLPVLIRGHFSLIW